MIILNVFYTFNRIYNNCIKYTLNKRNSNKIAKEKYL